MVADFTAPARMHAALAVINSSARGFLCSLFARFGASQSMCKQCKLGKYKHMHAHTAPIIPMRTKGGYAYPHSIFIFVVPIMSPRAVELVFPPFPAEGPLLHPPLLFPSSLRGSSRAPRAELAVDQSCRPSSPKRTRWPRAEAGSRRRAE